MKDIIKNILTGFWENGFVALLKAVLEHWIITFIIIGIICYLCSDSETSFAAWIIIGGFALITAIKALFNIIVGIINYFKPQNSENKSLILKTIGGKLFDLSLCLVGVFQALKVFTHVSRVTKASSSVISFVDDAACAVSNALKNIHK